MGFSVNLMANSCSYCHDNSIHNGEYVSEEWREANSGLWPKPYYKTGIVSGDIKGIVIGQDPTIDDDRSIEYALEADKPDKPLGRFLRQIANMLPDISINELYFTNLIKCRLKEKPGKDNRNISLFLHDMAGQCYQRFLKQEIESHSNARLIITLGRDTFNLVAELLNVEHEPLTSFKDYCATKLPISASQFGRECYVIPLPHLHTYDTANRYSPYSRDVITRKLAQI
jgi:uracil-DNA glycosylase